MNTKFDELLEFPCKFPFKVLGVADPALPDMVVEVLQQHAPGTYSPTVQPSSKGNYHSVRVTVTAQSKEHIEAMYTALGNIELVRYVLCRPLAPPPGRLIICQPAVVAALADPSACQ